MNIPRLPGLQDRRNNLVNRLFGQYASQNAHQLPYTKGEQAAAQQGGGTQFNRYVNPAAMARTQMTQFDNVPVNIRGLLGPGGQGRALGGDASGSVGGEVQSRPMMPLPSAPSMPLPGPGVGQPSAGNFTPASNFSPPTGDSFPGQPTQPNVGNQAGGPAGTVSGGGVVNDPFLQVPHDAIPLGGGSYWSPTQGIISGSIAASLGGASSRLGNSYQ